MDSNRSPYPVLLFCFLAIIGGILILHGHRIVTTPYGRFTTDSLNYADVARNILSGRGIVQSAVGFNDTGLSPDLPIPMPMTSQPPLYPLLVAFLAFFRLPIATASLIVSVTGMVIVVFGGIWLSQILYNDAAALLSGLGMLSFAPLYYVTDRAWSDTLATGLAILSMALLVTARRSQKPEPLPLVLSGLAGGLAFATRYAFLPLILLGMLVLIRRNNRLCTLRSIKLYLSGAVPVIGIVVGRNLLIDGTLVGSPRNPSTVGPVQNLRDTYLALFGTYLGDPFYWQKVKLLLSIEEEIPTEQTIGFILLAFALLLLILAMRRKLKEALIEQQRFLPWAWMAAYLGFLIFQRSQFHFDYIRSRLVFPGSVFLVILLAGMLVKAFSLHARQVIFPALLLASFGLVQAWTISREKPEMSQQEFLDRSIADQPVLDWINRNTSVDDLIIGDDSVDVVFYLDRQSAVSFSPYPYSRYLDYETLVAFMQNHCQTYRNSYLFIHSMKETEIDWMEEFGPFITDLAMDRVESYPQVLLRIPVEKGMVYQLDCR